MTKTADTVEEIQKEWLVNRVKELEDAIKSFPWNAYGDALREGCDADGAWECFCDEVNKHFLAVLNKK